MNIGDNPLTAPNADPRLMVEHYESYSCNECDRVFNDKSNLRRHKASLHRGAKHDCPNCHKTFTRKDTLSNHLKKNLCKNSNDSVCLHCKKDFIFRTKKKRHCKQVHKDRCECGEGCVKS